MSRSDLGRCTHLARQVFGSEVWGRLPSLSRAAHLPPPGAYADLFGIKEADWLLSRQGLRTPFLRAAKDGVALPPSAVSSSGGTGAAVADQVDDTKVARLFGDGATIVLQGLHRTHPPLEAFARGLGSELGHPVQVNAYLTPPQSQGFSSHYDTHDVFVLQVCGRKHWVIHPPVLDSPLPQQSWPQRREAVEAAAAGAPFLETELEPGDALYLPRGWLHAAVALEETTVHLTVGIHVWTRRHILERILASAGEAEALRASLPLGVDLTDPNSLDDDFRAAVDALHEIARTARLEDVASALARQATDATRPEPIAPLAQALLARQPYPDLRVRWRQGIPHDPLIPSANAEAVRRLHRGEAITAGELGLDAAGEALASGTVIPADPDTDL